MATNLNKRCQICGDMYNHCVKCKELAGWRAIADTHEHYQVATVIREHREGIIDSIEAKKMFENIGITLKSDFSAYLPEVARDIKKLILDGRETKTATKTTQKI